MATASVRQSNQVHPPSPKKKRVDTQGNDRRKVFVKSGTATLLLAKGLTENATKVFIQGLEDNIGRLGGTLECSFLVVK